MPSQESDFPCSCGQYCLHTGIPIFGSYCTMLLQELPVELVLLLPQDTKTFPKYYVGRNGKRNQQKLYIQVCGSLKTQWNQGCQG